ncbi:PREDICTED: prosaposin-like isoform X2 [Priapulus caudatus]|uniref:Prosaposin-like isoform X2 n=1 Tax=Priapulus caudatus TaxID=37621 RepID=A0ABM1EZB6_PRICU|nr:PREDICTED: prosaposin-like isoform X2 [Priapulus caudatus]
MRRMGPVAVFAAILMLASSMQVVEMEQHVKSEECRVCAESADTLHDIIAQNSTKEHVLRFLFDECTASATYTDDECRFIVDDFLKKTYEFSTDILKPRFLCPQLHLCAPAKQALFASEQNEVIMAKDESIIDHIRDDARCSFCQFFIETINGYLLKNTTVAELIVILEKVCDSLPVNETKKQECKLLMPMAAKFLQNLISKVPPDMACAILKLCPVKNRRREVAVLQMLVPTVTASIKCDLCTAAMGEVDRIIMRNQIVIQREAMELCLRLTAAVREKCVCHAGP